MSQWDEEIFNEDANIDFLDELNGLDDEDVVEAITDACMLVLRQDSVTEEERLNGQAAATIAAIWAGAPFSSGDIADEHPFMRTLAGSVSEELAEAAADVLETVEEDVDLDPFLEALS